MYIHRHVHTYGHIEICTHRHVHTQRHAHTETCTCPQTCTHRDMYIYTGIFTQRHRQTHRHTPQIFSYSSWQVAFQTWKSKREEVCLLSLSLYCLKFSLSWGHTWKQPTSPISSAATHLLLLSLIPRLAAPVSCWAMAVYRVPGLTLTPAEVEPAFLTESPGNPRKTKISETPVHQTFPSLLVQQIWPKWMSIPDSISSGIKTAFRRVPPKSCQLESWGGAYIPGIA